jgi:quinol monooxygenase YgiN
VPALRDELAATGVTPWALLIGQIGVPAGEVEVLVAGELAPSIDAVRTARLETTVRPTSDEPPGLDGVYALREFVTAPADVDELVALSAEAWPTFESANEGVRVLALFRDLDEVGRLLLVTRYPDLAAWERSRNAPEFQRRNALTTASIVRTYRPIPIA